MQGVLFTVFERRTVAKEGRKKYTKYVEMPAVRGKIFDRNGEILASSVLNYKVGIVPAKFTHEGDALTSFCSLVG